MNAALNPDLWVVDSSGWIEYLAGAPNADSFAAAIETPERLIVPTLSIAEVFKWVFRELGEGEALQAAALMQQGRVIDLDVAIALRAAQLGPAHGLPLADSIILATARVLGARLLTQDTHFEGLPFVEYLPKRP